jgi:hypothetical protein
MRRVLIEVTETYYMHVPDEFDGEDIITALDELDEDDAAGLYDSRSCRVVDTETNEELPCP